MTSFLFAGSLKQAQETAEIDWELTSIGTDTWETDEGEFIVYAYSLDAIFKHQKRPKIYIAHGASERKDYAELDKCINSMRVEVIKRVPQKQLRKMEPSKE